MADGERVRDLLRAEHAGTLTPEQTAAIKTLREAGQFPAPYNAAQAAYQRVREPLAKVSEGLLGGKFTNPDLYPSYVPPEQRQALAAEASQRARAFVPPTLTGALTQGATIAAGPFGAIPRIIAGGIGAGTGAALEGEPVLPAAIEGAAFNAGGEVTGRLLSEAARRGPGGPLRVNRAQAADLAQAIERQVPTLKGTLNTPRDLQMFAYDPDVGRRRIGDLYDAKLKEAETHLTYAQQHGWGGGFESGVKVPALGPYRVAGEPATVQTTGTTTVTRTGPYGEPVGTVEGPAKAVVSGGRGPDPAQMSLGEAMDLIKEIGHGGYGGSKRNPNVRTPEGAEARQVMQQALGQIKAQVPENVWTMIDGARREMSAALSLQELLRDSGAMKARGKEAFVDFGKAHDYFLENLAKFKDRMVPEDFAELVRALYHGGVIGSRDVATPGVSSPADFASRMARQGGGTGTTAMLPIKALLPGVGNQYAGRELPYTLPQGAQTVLDLMLQRAGGAGLTP